MNLRHALFLVMVLPGLAFASGTDADDVNDKPSFGKVINELSRFLSSTNPETKPLKKEPLSSTEKAKSSELSNLATSSGAAKQEKPMHVAIPKVIDTYEKPKPIPILTPNKVGMKNLVIQEPMLSPEAKRIFRKAPSNIGIIESASGSLAIERGKFGEEFQGETILKNQEFNKPQGFEIKVRDVKTTENEISMLDKGLKALLAGQYEGAIAIYKSVLVKQPKNRDALLGLATAYHKAGQRTQARLAYSNLLSKYPNFQDGLNNFLMLAAEEAPKDALEELEQLSVRNPNFAPIFAQKASIYSKMGNTDKAIENFVKAIMIAPENAAYKYNLATIYDNNGKKDKARSLYVELLEDSYKGKPMPVGRQEIADRLSAPRF